MIKKLATSARYKFSEKRSILPRGDFVSTFPEQTEKRRFTRPKKTRRTGGGLELDLGRD